MKASLRVEKRVASTVLIRVVKTDVMMVASTVAEKVLKTAEWRAVRMGD